MVKYICAYQFICYEKSIQQSWKQLQTLINKKKELKQKNMNNDWKMFENSD